MPQMLPWWSRQNTHLAGEQRLMGEILSRHRIQFPSSLYMEVEALSPGPQGVRTPLV